MSITITPSREDFLRRAADPSCRVIPVHARLMADDQTPVALYQQLCGDRELTWLLESADAGVWSRWSFIGVRSAATLVEQDGQAAWLGTVPAGLPTEGDPLAVLAQTLESFGSPADPALPPLASGMVGYLGYDIVRRLEKLPDSCVDDLRVPEMVMMMASDIAALDHHRGELWLIANALNLNATSDGAEAAYDQAVARIHAMVDALTRPRLPLLAHRGPAPSPEEIWSQVIRQRTSADFEAAVETAKEHIRAGDIFQVVPSQRYDLPCTADALSVYRELRVTNPSQYLLLMRMPGFQIVSASPEALVTVREGEATTRPIAGTRRRGRSEAEDLALERELLADEKERAEHVMLVDLGRNDLGRVCTSGTVQVTEFMQVRRYSHVMHLEAAVTGQLAPGRSALDATLACFPAGTLSGAPKVRAMQIIDDLEITRRGIYGGAIGYFDFAGNSEMAIAIRTALLKDGMAHVQAGAGIVADSQPALEDAETRHKAMAALTAVARAQRLEEL